MKKATSLGRPWLLAILPAVLSCGLSHDDIIRNLRQRAAFDMNCPPEQLVLTELTKSETGNVNTVGVKGCEQQAVYVRANNHTNWMLDGKKDTRP